eukprot:7235132-Prymnesium_polylepis.1
MTRSDSVHGVQNSVHGTQTSRKRQPRTAPWWPPREVPPAEVPPARAEAARAGVQRGKPSPPRP